MTTQPESYEVHQQISKRGGGYGIDCSNSHADVLTFWVGIVGAGEGQIVDLHLDDQVNTRLRLPKRTGTDLIECRKIGLCFTVAISHFMAC